jgi:hypothetical protein
MNQLIQYIPNALAVLAVGVFWWDIRRINKNISEKYLPRSECVLKFNPINKHIEQIQLDFRRISKDIRDLAISLAKLETKIESDDYSK